MRFVLPLVVTILGLLSHPTLAELRDHGQNGEYFHDTESGLYWMDPGRFEGMAKMEIDAFLDANPTWRYATALEVEDLVGKTARRGAPLTEVMGPEQFVIRCVTSDGTWHLGARWIGFFDISHSPVSGFQRLLTKTCQSSFISLKSLR